MRPARSSPSAASVIGARRLDQIGNQLVAALQLDMNLGEGLAKTVAQRHQGVIDRNGIESRHREGGQINHG